MNWSDCLFGRRSDGAVSAGLLVVRVVAGLAFVLHGWGKIQHPFTWMGAEAPTPAFLQALAAISEFGGGIAWILGALTPLFSFGIFCTMAVATHLHAIVMGNAFVASKPGEMSYEPALGYLAVALLLLLAGPGRYSVDALIWGRRND